MRDEREVLESPKIQGTNEERVYSFDFSNCGVVAITGTPTMVVLDRTDNDADVTSTSCPGTATAVGQVVTTPEVKALKAGREYRLTCRVSHDGGQITELYCKIHGVI